MYVEFACGNKEKRVRSPAFRRGFASNAWTHCPRGLSNDFSPFQSIFGHEDVIDRPECIKIEQSREENRDERANSR